MNYATKPAKHIVYETIFNQTAFLDLEITYDHKNLTTTHCFSFIRQVVFPTRFKSLSTVSHEAILSGLPTE